jgi:hypothetical protein
VNEDARALIQSLSERKSVLIQRRMRAQQRLAELTEDEAPRCVAGRRDSAATQAISMTTCETGLRCQILVPQWNSQSGRGPGSRLRPMSRWSEAEE